MEAGIALPATAAGTDVKSRATWGWIVRHPGLFVLCAYLAAAVALNWRLWLGLGTMTAFVVAWTVQIPTFSAPVIACLALQPSNVCTWRKLPLRLALTTADHIIFGTDYPPASEPVMLIHGRCLARAASTSRWCCPG